MAQRVEIHLVDDIDGKTAADETVTFGVDGASYEIDLTAARAEKLRKALAPYVSAARKVTKNGRGKKPAASAGKTDAKDVRVWARANGMDVPDRGRIPQSLREEYEAANR